MSASQASPPSPPLHSLVPILISRGAAITLVLAFHHFVHYYPALSIITALYIIISCSLSTNLYIIIRPTCNRFVVVKEEIKTMSPSMAYELGTMAYELGYVTCLMGGIRLIWLIMYSGNSIVLHIQVVRVTVKAKQSLPFIAIFYAATIFEVLIN